MLRIILYAAHVLNLIKVQGTIMKNKKAFTLMELLVVIAIIALLLAILLPSLQKVKSLTKRVVCSSNLRQQGLAFATYANEQNNKYPPRPEQGHWPFGGMGHANENGVFEPSGQASLLASGYIDDPEFFYCPGNNKKHVLGFERIFNLYQPAYQANESVENIDWEYFFVSYPYWVQYRTGVPHEDKNLASSVADSPLSRPERVVCSDIIGVNGNGITFGDFSDSEKYPHPFSGHADSRLKGGNVLRNDASVTWEAYDEMKDNWGQTSPLEYDRLRFVYQKRDDQFGNQKVLWWF